MFGYLTRLVRWALIPSALVAATSIRAQRPGQPSVQDMLALRPTQRYVDYDAPSADQIAGLKAELATEGKAKVWVLKDGAGRIYRRFIDSDRDGVVDQWVYYREGIEVYRDIDSNSNRLADQFRWINSGGTRWALDTNEDGKIDAYRFISAQEATREVMRAFVAKDFSVLEPVLARPADAPFLGKVIAPERLKDLSSKSRDQFASLASQMGNFTVDSQWVRMESQVPMLIPGDAPDGSRDVELYRNVQAIIQTGARTDVLQFGEIALVGRVAKILDLPTIVAPRAPTLAQSQVVFNNVPPEAPSDGPATDAIDKQQQELMQQLQKLDEDSAKIGPSEIASMRYQLQRADLLEKLAQRAKTDEDRTDWLRQQADCLIAAIQVSSAKEPQDKLARFYESLRSRDKKAPLASYVAFRQISAEYFRKLQATGSDFAAVQKEWLEGLEKFVTEYPDAEDTPEALSQLAIGLEFTGKEDAARENYQKIADSFPKSSPAPRAQGAIERLGLVGKPIKLRANDLRRGTVDIEKFSGKVVLVDYWSTTCDPWQAELPRLKEIYNKYHSKGFEIIGVSLDSEKGDVTKFVQSSSIPWPIAFEPGGLDSAPALQYGILALPTQFLVDGDGQVVSRTIHISQLEDEVKKLLK
jgi:thiol-disulfide isomerase/thioredoxin